MEGGCDGWALLAQGTLLMAMANGLPVVSTPYHFALEMLQDARGLLVPFHDNQTALTAALQLLLADGRLRAHMVRPPLLGLAVHF